VVGGTTAALKDDSPLEASLCGIPLFCTLCLLLLAGRTALGAFMLPLLADARDCWSSRALCCE
jgi:hypothetical protein